MGIWSKYFSTTRTGITQQSMHIHYYYSRPDRINPRYLAIIPILRQCIDNIPWTKQYALIVSTVVANTMKKKQNMKKRQIFIIYYSSKGGQFHWKKSSIQK